LSTGTPFTPLSPAVRNHRIAVRLPSESLSALPRIPHTVEWTMMIASGRTCTQGLRLGSIIITSVKLIAPPQSGKVDIQGPSFSYAAKADFQGQDEFTIQVSGTVVRIAGASDVKVTVFVVHK